jgi:hypothetical protein
MHVNYSDWLEKVPRSKKQWDAFVKVTGLGPQHHPSAQSWLSALLHADWETCGLRSADGAPTRATVALCTDGLVHLLPILGTHDGNMSPACGLADVSTRSVPVRPARPKDPRCKSCEALATEAF